MPKLEQVMPVLMVRDVDGLFAEFLGRGVIRADAGASAFVSGVRDTPFGTREFHVRDPDRNGLQFFRRR